MIKTISSTGQSYITMTTQLGEELSSISVIKNYQAAQKKLNEDTQATELLNKLSAARKKFSEKQFSGTITQDSINNFNNVKNEVEKNKTIIDYSQSQQEAIQFLRDLNLEISKLIGIDFSTLLPRNTTC